MRPGYATSFHIPKRVTSKIKFPPVFGFELTKPERSSCFLSGPAMAEAMSHSALIAYCGESQLSSLEA